jgi:hypothetical protein
MGRRPKPFTNCDFPAAIRNDRSTSIRDIAPTSQLRKQRSFRDHVSMRQVDPERPFPISLERAVNAGNHP